MYESFYGLKEKPFTLLPDPDYLYLSPKHHRALTLLEYGLMNHAGFSVICGDAGAGKTTLIRRLLAEMGDDTKVGLITNTHQSFGNLLNWVLMAFGMDGEDKTKAQMHQIFVEFLIEQYASNKRTILIVDEAQNMDVNTLEELRMLSNINADKDQILQVILVGQLALRDTLRKPEMMQFAQRIAVDYYLESLNESETELYILHRLKVAGANKPIFTAEACHAIYRFSGGTPRLINLLCDTALVYGFAEQTHEIGEKIITDVVSEQHHNSIIPTFNTASLDTQSRADKLDQRQVKDTHEKPNNADDAIASLAERAQQAIHETPDIAETADTAAQNSHSPTEADHEDTAKPDTTKVDESNEPVAADQHIEAAMEAVITAHEGESNHKEANTDTDSTNSDADSIKMAQEEQTPPSEEHIIVEEEPQQHHRRHSDNLQEAYPIIHVDDNKSRPGSLAIGIISGVIISLLLITVIAYFFIDNLHLAEDKRGQGLSNSVEQNAELERIRLQAAEKERDAALAISKALERERDAAIAAAKVQEEIRLAEKRAIEMVAEQKRKADLAMRLAEKRAREAELAAERARKAELESQQKAKALAEKQRIERALKQQRQEALRLKREAEAAQRALAEEQAQLAIKQREKIFTDDVQGVPPVQPNITNKQSRQQPEEKDNVGFSINPCDSPSAKFLSTCKR